MIKPPPEGLPDSASEAPENDDSKPASASGATSGEPADAIRRQLKTLFDGVVAEPVPDRLRQLVEQLGDKSGKTK
jgi:hypothetical protein